MRADMHDDENRRRAKVWQRRYNALDGLKTTRRSGNYDNGVHSTITWIGLRTKNRNLQLRTCTKSGVLLRVDPLNAPVG